MRSELIDVGTGSREVVYDLTSRCEQFVAAEAHQAQGDGLLHVFVPHATAGIAILETGAGSDTDLLAVLEELLPALIPPYASLPVIGGRLMLGTWQSICLVDTNVDNPRRQVRLSWLPS
jgi:thiamine phosphate synthase YjbQ (UPF0047 family)